MKEKIGLRIKALRKEKNINQEDLSSLSKLDRAYISRVESGKQNITIESLSTICECLNISLRDFFDCIDFE